MNIIRFHCAFRFNVHIFINNTLPDLPQHLKTFSLVHATSAVPENRASARIADAAVACNVLASVHDHSDTVYAVGDNVFELGLAVEEHYGEVYSAAASASK